MGQVNDLARYDRAAIMREAHRAYAIMKGRVWTYADALRFAWGRAREAWQRRLGELAAFERLCWAA